MAKKNTLTVTLPDGTATPTPSVTVSPEKKNRGQVALDYMISNAEPMVDEMGEPIADTGIVTRNLFSHQISAILTHADSKPGFRDGQKWVTWNFSYAGKAYAMQVRIANVKNKPVKITWDHRVFDPCDFLTPSDLWEGAM